MLEYEKKIPLTSREYEFLKRLLLKDQKIQRQTNFYFDTEDFSMNRRGITYRIREKNGTYTATVKEHNQRGGDCSRETSKRVDNSLNVDVFANAELKLKGCLLTERAYLLERVGISVVLDKNYYLDCEDYEIEIEYTPQYEDLAERLVVYFAKTLKSILGNFNSSEFLCRLKTAKSKSARFFARLEGRRKGWEK